MTSGLNILIDKKMRKVIIVAHKIPLNYNDPRSFVVEIGEDQSNDDAINIVRHQLRDLDVSPNYIYKVREYTPPPKGKIIEER